VVKSDADRVMYFPAGRDAAETMAARDFFARFETTAVLVARDPDAAAAHGDEPSLAKPAFGFRWFLPELLRHRPIWRNVLAASLVLQLIGLTTPLFTQVIIDKVIIHHTQSTLVAVGVGLALFLVFNTVITWLRQYFVLHTGNRIDAVLGSQVFRHLLRLPMPYFEHRPTGTLIARLHGVETIREFISGAAITLLLDLPFLVVFLAVMFWYSWQLTLIAVGMVLLLTLLSVAVTPGLRARINNQFLLGARNQAFLTEYVAGVETVKSLQMEPYLERRYDDLLASYLAAGFATRQYSNASNVLANAIEQTQTVAILCVGALIVMNNPGFTVGMLVAFQMFASRLSQPMMRLAGLWQEFQQANIAVKRLGDLMDAPGESYTLVPSRAPSGAGKLDVVGLSFRYSPNHPYLYRNLSLSLKPGQLTVITGPSGSGKSTLAKLMQGFYPPVDGRIEIDGRDIRYFSANELRQYFGVVPQETVLFSGTVYDNLVMASPHAGFEDVIEACRMAEIHAVIEKLPQGYQTVIGEHGVGLSVGQ
jgi:subfamily B ATP-binding cassette protein HlyB/CyaB